MDALLQEIHYLITKGYRVVFDYDEIIHATRITVDGEKDGQAFHSSQRIPRPDLPYTAIILAKLRREIDDLEHSDD